jgi:hypothetical protein
MRVRVRSAAYHRALTRRLGVGVVLVTRQNLVGTEWCPVVRGRTRALVVKMRVIIDRHSAIFLRFQFVIFRIIDFDFLRLVD